MEPYQQLQQISLIPFSRTVLVYTTLLTLTHISLYKLLVYISVKTNNKRLGNNTKLITQLPSYIISTVHAIYQTHNGIYHLLNLFRAPIYIKQHIPVAYLDLLSPSSIPTHHLPFMVETSRVHISNCLLTSYLLSDLFMVLYKFPQLGTTDVIVHHASFLYCSFIGGIYHINPFMFAWLILGEASTPFLNVRWFLLTLSKSNFSSSVNVIQFFFALFFFITRVALYSVGLLYQYEILFSFPHYIPKWTSISTFLFVVVGFFLNLSWFVKIVSRIFKSPKSKSQ